MKVAGCALIEAPLYARKRGVLTVRWATRRPWRPSRCLDDKSPQFPRPANGCCRGQPLGSRGSAADDAAALGVDDVEFGGIDHGSERVPGARVQAWVAARATTSASEMVVKMRVSAPSSSTTSIGSGKLCPGSMSSPEVWIARCSRCSPISTSLSMVAVRVFDGGSRISAPPSPTGGLSEPFSPTSREGTKFIFGAL